MKPIHEIELRAPWLPLSDDSYLETSIRVSDAFNQLNFWVTSAEYCASRRSFQAGMLGLIDMGASDGLIATCEQLENDSLGNLWRRFLNPVGEEYGRIRGH